MKRISLIITGLFVATHLWGQNPWNKMAQQPNTLHPELGSENYETDQWKIEIFNYSQTIKRLEPKNAERFDFTPSDRLEFRDIDGCYHLGDINLTLKIDNEWKSFSSAKQRQKLVVIEARDNVLMGADITPTMGANFPVKILRTWETDKDDLILKFRIKNIRNEKVEIGSLGLPMIFNNILDGKSLDDAHAQNVFYDPYIGKDAGYLQVVRLHGHGPVLLVLPEKNTGFEAYNPLNDDPTPRWIPFEGFHEWMVHSKAHAEEEWNNAKPWNTPTSKVLVPGEVATYSWRFTTANSVKEIESKLIEKRKPVAVGLPGYVLPTDIEGKLMLNYPSEITNITAEPAEKLEWNEPELLANGWRKLSIRGEIYGRSRLTITYADGITQTINYKVINPESETIDRLGNFLTTKQWYQNDDDIFGRSPSVMNYDYENKEIVTQDSRAWIVGLGDEGGSGPYLSAIMKQLVQPDAAEIKKLTRFIDETLWGGIQYSEGPEKYGVRKSLFYYEPDSFPAGTYRSDINYNTWAAWNKEHSELTERSYNYPHVTASHWVMYRLARYRTDLVKNRSWKWYLEHAFHTAMAMVEHASYYSQFGQMEGTIFVMVLKDLKKEGLTALADEMEAAMKKRADHWKSLGYPFGSEMPWDSTGQEEVYMWSKYFGYDEKAEVTLNAILAYMPTVPHWGYNGSARRYWDFLYGGIIQRIERQLHHYGSPLNAIPVLRDYRDNPDDLYLLRVGHAGMIGGIANITDDGFGPAAFHSYPSTLKIDPLSGDYGSGFFGYAINNSSYLINDEQFGWIGFGGNATEIDGNVKFELTSSSKSRLYIAPEKLWINLYSGQIKEANYNTEDRTITLVFNPKDEFTPKAYLDLTDIKKNGNYIIPRKIKTDKIGSYVKFRNKEKSIVLVKK